MRTGQIVIVSAADNCLDNRVRPCRTNFGLLTRLVALLAFAASGRMVLAQREITPREVDQQLNATYQAVLRDLTPAAVEKLRKAQRAWLVFVEKNTAAMRTAAQPLGIPSSKIQRVEVSEVANRSADFYYSKEVNAGESFKAHFQRVDGELNAVYGRCLTLLAPAGQAALREAQRAWIDYREANRPFGWEFLAGLTLRRADQLTEFYVQSTTPPIIAKGPAKAEPAPPDPFERAR